MSFSVIRSSISESLGFVLLSRQDHVFLSSFCVRSRDILLDDTENRAFKERTERNMGWDRRALIKKREKRKTKNKDHGRRPQTHR